MTSGRARTLVFGFLVCSLENLFFQYNDIIGDIISTSKFPIHNPLVMKYYNFFFAYFSLDYKNCPFIYLYIYPIHILKLHGPWIGVFYAWMNGYATLLHNIVSGKCIVIKVEYRLQLHFKTFLTNQTEKKQQQK